VTTQEQALVELAGLLGRQRVPYMVIGGLAAAVWGEPRTTLDVDVTVWVPDADIARLVERLEESFELLAPEPRAFIARTRVLPMRTRAGIRIDLIFGLLSFEEEAIRRALEVKVGSAVIRFCSPEDLILHKIISTRERDLADARAVVVRRLATLDFVYLEPRVAELASLLERPEIAERWATWKRDAAG
jgi:hypothetical protein